MLIPLAQGLVVVMEAAATAALARGCPIELQDLLIGLQAAPPPLGAQLALAVRPIAMWTPTRETYSVVSLAIWAQGQSVPFTTETQRLYLAGADSVILGSYDAHHLALALGVAAKLHPERFRCFGFEASAWQQALQGKSANR